MAEIRLLDTRIAYGAQCTWWDGIREVGKSRSGLPCCPRCGGMLYETENEGNWFRGVDKHNEANHGYRAMVEWARGRCFKNYSELQKAYEESLAATPKN